MLFITRLEENHTPAEIIIPLNIEGDEESISDYLSEVTGFCHKGFELVDLTLASYLSIAGTCNYS